MQTFAFRAFGFSAYGFKAFGTPSSADGLIAIPATLSLSVAAGPVAVTIRNSAGGALSSSRALSARAEVSRPGYVAVTRAFTAGHLVVTPVAVGSGTITVVYGDQVNDERTVVIPFTVGP